MSVQILGVGTAVPEGAVSQQEAARLALAMHQYDDRLTTGLSTLYAHTTIRRRHSVLVTSAANGHPPALPFFPIAKSSSDRGPTTAVRMERYEAEAVDLASEAAESALAAAGCAGSGITHLVTVSCSGFSSPGVDIGLIERLNLPRNVARTNVGFMGCHGALNGLRVAAAFASSCPHSQVLVCCVEICTIHHQYTQQFDQLIANSLFSDGAAAVVVANGASQNGAWNLVDQKSHVVRDSADRMSWRIGDHGFVMTLSSEVPGIIRRQLRSWVADWLSGHGLTPDHIRGWIVHPGGPHILSACREVLELEAAALEESHAVLAEYGNMSSPTVFFILDRIRHDPTKLPCVMLAFGPGLTIEGALFR